MAKVLVKTKTPRGNYGTPVSYTRQNSYNAARKSVKSKSSAKV